MSGHDMTGHSMTGHATGGPHVRLTLAQQAAAARISYALEQSATVSLLCGPGGVGKTTVLRHVAAGQPHQPRSIGYRRLDQLDDLLSGRARDEPPSGLLLVDDAHLAGEGDLGRLVERCRQRGGSCCLVLAGEGRLLTLVSRDPRLEQVVRLRATLPAFSLEESRLLLEPVLAAAGPPANRDAVARSIHEIAAGIPATVHRLAELALVLVASHPDHRLVPDDVETIHRRLSLTAA